MSTHTDNSTMLFNYYLFWFHHIRFAQSLKLYQKGNDTRKKSKTKHRQWKDIEWKSRKTHKLERERQKESAGGDGATARARTNKKKVHNYIVHRVDLGNCYWWRQTIDTRWAQLLTLYYTLYVCFVRGLCICCVLVKLFHRIPVKCLHLLKLVVVAVAVAGELAARHWLLSFENWISIYFHRFVVRPISVTDVFFLNLLRDDDLRILYKLKTIRVNQEATLSSLKKCAESTNLVLNSIECSIFWRI